jgi:integrase
MGDDKSRVKTLTADNIEDALVECKAFRESLKEMHYQKVAMDDVLSSTPVLLVDCIEDFMAFIRDENVPHHKRGNRTDRVIKHYERSLMYLCLALERNGIDSRIVRFSQLNDNAVGYFNEFLLNTKGFRNKTYNNHMAEVKKFSRYIRKKYSINGEDPFSECRKRKVMKSNKSIEWEEFLKVLELTTHENSFVTDIHGKVRNYYKPWLKVAFELGLYTGGRREEVVNMKWNGIILNRSGDFSRIEVNHYKLTRANKNILGKGDIEIKKVPMNEDLKELLYILGYEKNKGKDQYILAPEETCTREHMMNLITKTFNMYFRLADFGIVKQFKDLRKTYSTTMYILRGEKAHEATGHEGMGILKSNYIDDNAVLEAMSEEFKKLGKIFER